MANWTLTSTCDDSGSMLGKRLDDVNFTRILGHYDTESEAIAGKQEWQDWYASLSVPIGDGCLSIECRKTLELCHNNEYLALYSGLETDRISDHDLADAASDLHQKLANLLEDVGFVVINPKGERITFHGWNGANTFKHKLGPIGTFDKLTESELGTLYKCWESALELTQRLWACDNG